MKFLDKPMLLHGFSLIELMIVLLLTSVGMLVIHSNFLGLIKATLISNDKTDLQVKSQQVAYWFEQTLNKAGSYNRYDSRNKLSPSSGEAEFIIRHPFVLLGTLANNPELGVRDGDSDTIVMNTLADIGCNGQKFHYAADELFHVVNEIFVEFNELRCRSYDGRYLTGKHNIKGRWNSVSLAQGLSTMQVKYLVEDNLGTRYINAELLTNYSVVKAIKIELWLTGDKASLQSMSLDSSSLLEPDTKVASDYIQQRLLLVVPLIRDTLYD